MQIEQLESRVLFSAVAADADHSGIVDVGDFNVWFSHVGSNASVADMNHDGYTDLLDFDIWLSQIGFREYNGQTATIDGVLNVWAPNPVDYGATRTVTQSDLFGISGVPDIASIIQGPAADCYFLAGIGAIAFQNPQFIQHDVTWDGQGFAVGWAGAFGSIPMVVHTSAELSQGWQLVSFQIWPQVMEKAYTYYRTANPILSNNLFIETGNGFASIVQAQLGFKASNVTFPTSDAAATEMLASELAAGDYLTLITPVNAPTFTQNHTYIITGADVTTDTIYLYNPHGYYTSATMSEVRRNSVGFVTVAR